MRVTVLYRASSSKCNRVKDKIQLNMLHVVAYHMATTTTAAGSSGIAGSCKSQYTSSFEIRHIRGSIHIK